MPRKLLIILLFSAAALLLPACNLGVTTVTDVKICDNMTGDKCADDKTMIDASATRIFVSGDLNDAFKDTELVVSWQNLDKPESSGSETLVTDKDGSGPFSFAWDRPETGWITGRYEVTLQLSTDDSAPIVKDFEIK